MKLPEDFQRIMSARLGEAEYNRLSKAIDTAPPTSIRLNNSKIEKEELSTLLTGAEPVGWWADAYYLAERPQFTFDPLLHAGCYYVQEASSMYIGKLLRHYSQLVNQAKGNEADAPLIALDSCAAPGGKSTLALSSLPAGSLLVANEYVRQRSQILAENLMKWGNPNVIVTNSDTKDFTNLPSLFDIILCDAPCSGEGMFRKDEKAIEEWSLDNVQLCQSRQREIISNLWQSLRPNGIFIYSTCTFNEHEDEENAAWMQAELHAQPLPLLGTDSFNIPNGHFYPHLVRGEGFFVAVFQKPEDEYADTNITFRKKKKDTKGKNKNKPSKLPKELASWLNHSEQFVICEPSEGTYNAFPLAHTDVLSQIADATHTIHSGITLATLKGKNLQPAHNLAMSNNLNTAAFATAEVDYTQAIAYLRTEAITLPAGTPTGYVLITYQGHPLGFVKNIGNRANNLYPSEWKIKSTYIPQR